MHALLALRQDTFLFHKTILHIAQDVVSLALKH